MRSTTWILLFAALALVFTGCAEKKGDPGAAGTAGTSTGTVSGAVTNALNTSTVMSGVTVTTDPSTSTTITTDSSGNYSVDLPIGSYTLSFDKSNFETATTTVSVAAGQTATANVAMTPSQPVSLSAGSNQSGVAPGAAVALTATTASLDGSSTSGTTYSWKQTAGTPVSGQTALNVELGTSASLNVTLATSAQYKANLFTPPVDSAGDAHYPTDRLMVQGFSVTRLDDALVDTFQVTASVPDPSQSSGTATYTSTVNVSVSDSLPYKVSTGLENVPLGVPVVIRGKSTGTGWGFVPASGSSASLQDTSGMYPYFTPDVAGEYTVVQNGVGTINVWANSWSNGLIGGMGTDGFPTMGANCSTCHTATGWNNGVSPTDAGVVYGKYLTWRESGHAGIFTQRLNIGGARNSCWECHNTGYNTDVANNGFDDTTGFQDWLDNSGMFTHSGSNYTAVANAGNWAKMLSDYLPIAAKSNVQCEACHGPGGTGANDPTKYLHNNGTLGDAGRVSWSSDVCGSCHGEATRHDRYDQWREAGHSNFTMAESEATVENQVPSGSSYGAGDCGRCHSAQGFVAWIEDSTLTVNGGTNAAMSDFVPTGAYVRGGTDPLTDASGYTTALSSLGLDLNDVQPQTCQACHDPHQQGREAYIPNTSTVRVEDNTSTLPGGFAAYGVGRGAVCMTCHNQHDGAHNDTSGNQPKSLYRPMAVQAGMLMGQNAYFVTVGNRSPHSYIPDTCSKCHMELSPPPSEFSYPGEPGTNHEFSASTSICSNCHGSVFTADGVQNSTTNSLTALASKISDAVKTTVNGSTTYVTAYNAGSFSTSPVQIGSGTSYTVTAVSLTTVQGQEGFTITLSSAVSVPFASGSSSLSTFSVRLDKFFSDAGGTTQIYPLTSNMAKALWNYWFISQDGSKGVHNPGFVNDIVNGTLNATL